MQMFMYIKYFRKHTLKRRPALIKLYLMQQLELIQQKIYEVRGQKVMLDFDLAELYEVETKVLNQAVKRNQVRFPQDFMFRLTREEWDSLRSQIAIL